MAFSAQWLSLIVLKSTDWAKLALCRLFSRIVTFGALNLFLVVLRAERASFAFLAHRLALLVLELTISAFETLSCALAWLVVPFGAGCARSHSVAVVEGANWALEAEVGAPVWIAGPESFIATLLSIRLGADPTDGAGLAFPITRNVAVQTVSLLRISGSCNNDNEQYQRNASHTQDRVQLLSVYLH
jgi:hypothetical protein